MLGSDIDSVGVGASILIIDYQQRTEMKSVNSEVFSVKKNPRFMRVAG